MSANPEQIQTLVASSKKEINHRDMKHERMGMQTESNGSRVNSGSMTGCHLVIGADATNKNKFFSHDNFLSGQTMPNTKSRINNIGPEGKFYLFLTRKSLTENGIYNENVQACVRNMESYYDVKFNRVYYIDDRYHHRVEVDFNFETGRMTVDGVDENFEGGKFKVELSIYETNIPMVDYTNQIKQTAVILNNAIIALETYVPSGFNTEEKMSKKTDCLSALNKLFTAANQGNIENFKQGYLQLKALHEQGRDTLASNPVSQFFKEHRPYESGSNATHNAFNEIESSLQTQCEAFWQDLQSNQSYELI
jgi:hypothetical protein